MKPIKDVHTEHCCLQHGCKYRDPDCTVVQKRAPQSFRCEDCEDDLGFSAPAMPAAFKDLVAKTRIHILRVSTNWSTPQILGLLCETFLKQTDGYFPRHLILPRPHYLAHVGGTGQETLQISILKPKRLPENDEVDLTIQLEPYEPWANLPLFSLYGSCPKNTGGDERIYLLEYDSSFRPFTAEDLSRFLQSGIS